MYAANLTRFVLKWLNSSGQRVLKFRDPGEVTLFFTCSVFEILLYPLPFFHHNRVTHSDAFRWHLLKHSSWLIAGLKLPWEKIKINSNNGSSPYSHCCSQCFTTPCRAYFLPKNCKQSKKQRKVAHIPHWHQLTACMSRQGREWWTASGQLCHETDHKHA